MPRNRRKVVLVIVEGPSDETALEQPFAAMFNPDEVRIKVIHGDITADMNITSDKIVSAVGSLVKSYASRYGLKQQDFLRVIHIADTDGAYIPDADVIEDVKIVGRPLYSDTGIHANPKSKIKERNARKRAKLNKLSSVSTVWTQVPYSIYYMASNLDHVLYGLSNSDDASKRRCSFAFATRFKGDLAGFKSFISSPEIAVAGDYKTTWEFIRLGLNSLQRHTNLNLCFTT